MAGAGCSRCATTARASTRECRAAATGSWACKSARGCWVALWRSRAGLARAAPCGSASTARGRSSHRRSANLQLEWLRVGEAVVVAERPVGLLRERGLELGRAHLLLRLRGRLLGSPRAGALDRQLGAQG